MLINKTITEPSFEEASKMDHTKTTIPTREQRIHKMEK